MKMLRKSCRLSSILAANGYSLYDLNGLGDVESYTEADCVLSQGPWSARCEDSSHPAPFDADCFILNLFNDDASTCNFHCASARTLSMSEAIDFLWVSETEFLSCHAPTCLENRGFMRMSYRVDVESMEVKKCFRGYRLEQLTDLGEESAVESSSGLVLHFLAHQFAQILNRELKIQVQCSGYCPVEAALSVVPTALQNMVKAVAICFVCPSMELVTALAYHPIHPRVVLSFDSEHTFKVPWSVNDQELNDALREFRYPLQLKVPYRLVDFSGEGEIFTTNPAFTSLTIVPSIPRMGPKVLSGKMLDGIALNKSVAALTIDVQHWTSFDWDEEIPEFISTLFSRLICASSSSIRSIFTSVSAEQRIFLGPTDLIC
jgi:hypothetical protein